jgi:hypothetical protein
VCIFRTGEEGFVEFNRNSKNFDDFLLGVGFEIEVIRVAIGIIDSSTFSIWGDLL